MARIYDTSQWRALPRDRCVVHEIVGGECEGAIALHHVVPITLGGAADGRTVPVCARHHPMLEALARRAHGQRPWRTCPHHHRTAESRRRCEARLNADALESLLKSA